MRFIYKNQINAQIKTYLKVWTFILLHVSARLRHPQGVRTPNLKLVGIV